VEHWWLTDAARSKLSTGELLGQCVSIQHGVAWSILPPHLKYDNTHTEPALKVQYCQWNCIAIGNANPLTADSLVPSTVALSDVPDFDQCVADWTAALDSYSVLFDHKGPAKQPGYWHALLLGTKVAWGAGTCLMLTRFCSAKRGLQRQSVPLHMIRVCPTPWPALVILLTALSCP